MSFSGLTASVSGIDSITRKKIELHRGFSSRVQLFFTKKPDPDCSICVIPAAMVSDFFESKDIPAFFRPPVIGFGPSEAMGLSLAAGCSDYLCSPWEPDEFYVRISVCLQKVSFRFNDASFFSEDGMIICRTDDGLTRTARLSNTEKIILKAFCRNRGCMFSRQMLQDLLQRENCDGSRAIDMDISRLRKKIFNLSGRSAEDSPIITASGQGWGIM